MWIQTQALFKNKIDKVEWDLMSDDEQLEATHASDYRFNSDELVCYNNASNGQTTIVLKEYGSIIICMTVQELDKIIFGE